MANSLPQPFFLGGPTASGKSAVALALARRLGARIVNADAFQIYAGLPILTAQPSLEMLSQAPHELYGVAPVETPLDVASYWKVASPWLHHLSEPIIIVGGTGLYMRTLLRGGLDPLPPADPELRRELEATPLQDLTERLRQLDPVAHRQIDLFNPRRVVRALEVCLLSGQPVSLLRRWTSKPDAEKRGVWLQWDRSLLHERIGRRSHAMLENGAIEEVAMTRQQASSTARQAIGFRNIESLLDGELNQEECRESIAQTTRRYAKRQETWFRKEAALSPLPFQPGDTVATVVEKVLTSFSS